MNLYRYLCFSLILNGLALQLWAQATIVHRAPIEVLGLDAEGELIVGDGRRFYSLHGHNLISKNAEYSHVSQTPEYEIENGQLKKNLGSNFSFYPLPFEPLAVFALGNKLLCSSAEGLWVVEDGEAKRLYVPGQNFPENIVTMAGGEGILGMLTSEKSLYIYDTVRQIIKFIDTPVDLFTIDKWNCLWYSTEKVQLVKQDASFVSNEMPVLEIIKVIDAYNSIATEPITIDKEKNFLYIFFRGRYAPSFDKLAYSYSIDGDDWVPCYEGMAIIRGLEPGRHEIILRAAVSDDLATLSSPIKVKVESGEFGLLWPLLFGGLLLLGFFMWLSQQRMQRSLDKLAIEKEKILMELQLSNEKQRAGQLQMNPHFIFNTLNSISGLIALNENKLARNQLNKFSKMMRSVLAHSMKEYVPLTEELSFLEDYLSLEKLIRNDKFSFRIESDVQELCLVPPMLLQPFLENAIVHGLNRKEAEGLLTLRLEEKNKLIKVTIEDNGIGRTAAAMHKKEGHESAALDIIEHRLKALNRWNDVGLVYEDLYDEQSRPAGTRVTLHLPKQKI